MVDLVLVHGTTQSPAGFDTLIAALAERGHRAVAPQITAAAQASAADHVELLAAQVPGDLARPVVMAHSASGLLLPALARRLNARHQVWLAAAVADYRGRRSLLAELRENPAAVVNPEWIGTDPTRDPALASYFLFHDADLATLRHALGTVQACDLSGVYAETPADDPAGLPSTYLLPVDDRTVRPEWMARVARERLGVEPVELPGGHNLYAAHPARVADAVIAGLGR